MIARSLFSCGSVDCVRRGGVVLLAAFLLMSLCGTATEHDIRHGPGVTEVLALSTYHEPLAGTPGDTPVYVLEGTEPGGTVLILGGSHAGEIASVMAALLIVEQARVITGRVFVIPHANNSAAWNNEGLTTDGPRTLTFTNPHGEERVFAYGTRLTDPDHQEPDEAVFVHYPSGMELPGHEARNLNRVHPGRPDGTLTQQMSYALFELARLEGVSIVIDMHEAPPTSRLANMLISHPRGLDVAVMAVMHLELLGIRLGVEASRPEFFGLSHREFGDHTDALAFLIESPNPAQESIGRRGDPVHDPDHPLTHRVRLQLLAIGEILDIYGMFSSEGRTTLEFPFSMDELLTAPLGAFLR